ncbi:inner membrane protein YrbG [Klebsiella pneumoniae]|nr:inner membrane protein YrbG [Klebsiella pneumoniae]
MSYVGDPPLIIGMTVVSIGTSLPEIMVATAASLHGQADLAVGTALGSNITNILLIPRSRRLTQAIYRAF